MVKKSLFAFVLLGLLQCGGAEPEVVASQTTAVVLDAESCNQIKFRSECSEFTGAAKTVAKTLCEEGVHAEKACPGSAVGKCNTGKGIAKVYYAAGGKSFTAASAKADCDKMEGEYLP